MPKHEKQLKDSKINKDGERIKKIFKKIIKNILVLSIPLSVSCGQHDGLEKAYYKKNSPPVIEAASIPVGKAGTPYSAQLYVYDENGDDINIELKNLPEGMRYNIIPSENKYLVNLTWAPIHSKVGPVVSQDGIYEIEINASDGIEEVIKKIIIEIKENETLDDYLQDNGEIRQRCEQGCPANSEYLKRKFIGVNNAVSITKEMMGKDLSHSKKPVEIHYTSDTTCPYTGFNYSTITADGRGLICLIKNFDSEGNGSISMWAEGPADIRDQQVEVHEYGHLLFEKKPDNFAFQESAVKGIAAIITDQSGYIKTESLCDRSARDPNYPLFSDLCQLFGFDIDDFPTFFKLKPTEDVQYAKCIIDKILETDTYQAFYNASIDVPIGYCGDKIRK